MDARQISRSMALMRISLGTTAFIAPGPLARMWIGLDGGRPSVRTLARGLGARDLALGLGTVFALRRQGAVRGWLEAGALADAGDLVATLLSFRHLPPRWRLLVSVTAAAATGMGLAAARSLGGGQYQRERD